MNTDHSHEFTRSRILLIEDHAVFAAALARLLARRGPYDVEVVSSADEALVRLESGGIDLALTNVALPEHSGIWLAQQLRRIHPTLPVLVISGYANQSYVDDALRAGARGYVLKEDVPGLLQGVRLALTGATYVSDGARGNASPRAYPAAPVEPPEPAD